MAWQKAAHALKGIAYNLGAIALGNLSKDAQEKYDMSHQDKHDLLKKIEIELRAVLEFLSEEEQK